MAKKAKSVKKYDSLAEDAFVASLSTVTLVLAYVVLLRYTAVDPANPTAVDILDSFIRNIMYLLILYPLQAIVYIGFSLKLKAQKNPVRVVLLCMPIHIVLFFLNASMTLYDTNLAVTLLRIGGIILFPYIIVSVLVGTRD